MIIPEKYNEVVGAALDHYHKLLVENEEELDPEGDKIDLLEELNYDLNFIS